MGQRLVVSVRHLGEDIARIYYHWSAFSVSALEEARKVVETIYDDDDMSVRALQLRLIRMVEESGGGIDGGKNGTELARIVPMFPEEEFKESGASRNNGLIALSKSGMEHLLYWAEGTVTIDLDEDMIENDVYYDYDLESYMEENDAGQVRLDDFPDIGVELSYFPVSYLDHVLEKLQHPYLNAVRHGGSIYQLIE
ncbi:MAG: hypothetical protein ACLUE8_01810 [Lachnospiraceae bacterium]